MTRPILIVGTGSAARRHADNLRVMVGGPMCVATRSDRDLFPFAVGDLVGCLEFHPHIAVIASQTAYHIQDAIECAKAGCHLFIEKPLSHNMDGVEELAAICAEKNLTTMVGYQYRFHPALVRLKRQIAEGQLGAVYGARAEWFEYLADWHPGEDYRTSYAASDVGGGAVLTLSHPVDYLRWLFGDPSEVMCATRDAPDMGTLCRDDYADMILGFPTGVLAGVVLDYRDRDKAHWLRVTGLGGCHEIDLRLDEAARNEMFLAEMREFLSAVQERRPSSIPLSEGIATLKVLLEARHDAGLDG